MKTLQRNGDVGYLTLAMCMLVVGTLTKPAAAGIVPREREVSYTGQAEIVKTQIALDRDSLIAWYYIGDQVRGSAIQRCVEKLSASTGGVIWQRTVDKGT